VENQRAVAVLFIIGGVLAGVFFRSATLAVIGYASLEDPLLGGIVASSGVAGFIAGVITLGVLLRNQRAGEFVDSVVTELKNVTWPSREETFSNTGIVIGSTVFFATLLASYDFLWAKLTGLFIYTTG
jgi:preprotein translocase SecE subunit